MGETKIIYHIDDEDTPYLIKLPIPADRVTLGDFKNALNRPNFKFFFKSMDDDFGVVKEEIVDEDTHLPCFNGRVVSWLVQAENTSDTQSQCTESQSGDPPPPTGERLGGIGDSRPPSFHANASTRAGDSEACDTCTDTDSVVSSRRDGPSGRPGVPRGMVPSRHKAAPPLPHHNRPHHPNNQIPRINGHGNKMDGRRPGGDRNIHGFDATSSVMSSDIESTSFFDSEDDSRFSTITDTTSRSSKYGRHRRRRRRHRMPPISRNEMSDLDEASSFSSITDSTMSLNIITVTLNMDTVNFLGISIVGQSNKGGDGGIYVGSIMKGGAVALDGRIEPGDMILEVNGVSFENKSNDDAVRTLREAVQKPGPITLVVAKCWDPNPKDYFTVPRQEPVRPIDPSAWVAHTEAIRTGAGPPGMLPPFGGTRPIGPPSVSTLTSTSSSLSSSLPDSERFDDLNLTTNTDMASVVRAMAQPDSGLEIRDRMWLKITIPNAFIGSDLVDWLHTNVEGFADRRDARKYATNLLKAGYIRHTVNKLSFSEQCYYVFGDLCGVPPLLDYSSDLMSSGSQLAPPLTDNLSSLTLEDIDSVSEADGGRERDTLGPLPPPAWANTYNTNPYGPSYMPPPPAPMNYAPPAPYNYAGNDSASYVSMPGGVGAESMHSSAVRDKTCACIAYHTYKQIRRLWENPEKANMTATAAHNGYKVPPGKFDDDIERSTSSSTGSSASGNSQTRGGLGKKEKGGGSGGSSGDRKSPAAGGSGGSDTETSSVISSRPPGAPPLPPPPYKDRDLPPAPPLPLGNINSDLVASRGSFRMAMGNPYSDETQVQMMGDL